MNRAKIIAKLTGFISIAICIIYLLFISVFDFRSYLNDFLVNQSENMGVIVSSVWNYF